MVDEVIESIRLRLEKAQKVLVVSHVRPDGDAVGALLAMGLGLKDKGKKVTMVLNDGVPSNFRHLAGSDQIEKEPKDSYDTVIVVDCSELKRAGSAVDGIALPDINIDHHITNPDFAKINLVNAEAVATSAILARYFSGFGLEITPSIANALLAGIISDTLGFRTCGVKPGTLRLAADLMEKGGNLPEQYSWALLRRSFSAAQYWGAGLLRLQRDGRMVWGTLKLEDRKLADYPGNDDADLINIISAINDFDISMIFVEQKNNSVKVSWRASPGYDVSKLAVQFGGGGHPAAAGADIPGVLDDIQPRVLAATKAFMDHQIIS
jgi:bifunctional oligoribonuclease and PAP phosphatase NrnA